MKKEIIFMPQEIKDLASDLEAKSGISLTDNARKGLMILIFNASSSSGRIIFNRKFAFGLRANYYAYLAKLESKEAYLKQYFSKERPSVSDKSPIKLENSEVKSIKDVLLATNHMEESMYFINFNEDHFEFDDEYKDELNSELQKSLIAHKKQNSGEISLAQYEEVRGQIWNPHSGDEGFDPMEHLNMESYIKNFDVIPSLVANPGSSDFNDAVQIVLKDNPDIAYKILEKAGDIFAQRLVEQEANDRK